mgnify:CR=1 FL=1
MERITIPNKTVWDAGDVRIAVGYIVAGPDGPEAHLEVLPSGIRASPRSTGHLVHRGSTFQAGARSYRVLDLVTGPAGGGGVILAPQSGLPSSP